MITKLPGAQYFEAPSSKTSVLFVPFTLRPGDSWTHNVHFLNYFDRATERAFKKNLSRLNTDIREKIKQLPEGVKEMVKADLSLVQPFVDQFRRTFIWVPGEYVMGLRVDAEPGSASFRKAYRFTLYESDSRDMTDELEGYAFGAGIAFDSERNLGVSAQILEQTS